MNDLALIMLGTLARTTAVGILAAVIVARLSRHRGPAHGAMAAHAGLLSLLLTAALSVLPWPQSWVVRYPSQSNAAESATVPAEPVSTSRVSPKPTSPLTQTWPDPLPLPPPQRSVHTESQLPNSIPVAINTTGRAQQRTGRSDPPAPRASTVARASKNRQTPPPWPLALLALLSAGWIWGTLRLATSLLALRQCVARSRSIHDPRLRTIAAELTTSLGFRQNVALLESSATGMPATIGLFHPCILLPQAWRDWTDEECRVVLGHELAHIRQGDFAARMLGHLCVIVHFYHPIAHWLLARMKLEQELAADAWGIRLSGGRASYLMTLSRMALRHDALRSREFNRSLLSFDGWFLRRIDMLSSDRALAWAPERSSWRARMITFSVLGLVAILVMVVRPPLAPADHAGTRTPVVEPTTSPRHNTEIPFDLSHVPADTVGIIAIRPSSLVTNETMHASWALAKIADSDRPDRLIPRFTKMGLSPESIEQILYVQLKADLETALKDPISIARRAALIIRSKSAVDTKAIAAEFKEMGAKHHLTLTTPDQQTAIIGDEATVKQIVEKAPAPTTKYAWSEEWSSVERSQIAMAIDVAYARDMLDPLLMDGSAFELTLFASPLAPIWEHATSASVGLTVVGDDLEILSLNVASTIPQAENTQQTVQALMTLARNAAGSLKRQWRSLALLDGSSTELFLVSIYAKFFTNQVLEHTRVERTGHTVRFSTRLDLDTLVLVAKLLF